MFVRPAGEREVQQRRGLGLLLPPCFVQTAGFDTRGAGEGSPKRDRWRSPAAGVSSPVALPYVTFSRRGGRMLTLWIRRIVVKISTQVGR